MLIDKIQTILNEGVLNNVYGGAALLVFKGGKELIYADAGCQSKEETVPLTRQTLFRVYSMSKPITSAAAMILVDRGDLDLNAPVADYLHGFKSQKYYGEDGMLYPVVRDATVVDLFNMTSGLVYPGDEDAAAVDMATLFAKQEQLLRGGTITDTVALMNLAGECPLAFSPGEKWRYGISADVLGAVIEKVSGKSFSSFLADELLTPLGMADTGFRVPDAGQDRLACVYQRNEDDILVPFTQRHLGVGGLYEKEPAFASGGAGLVSTIDDYMAFAQMLQGRGTAKGTRILSPQAVQAMTTPGLTPPQLETFWDNQWGYSYSRLMRVRVQSGLGVTLGNVGEYGWGGWLGTEFVNDPVQGLSFVFMTQRKDTPSGTLFNRLKNAVYGAL